MEKSKPPIIKLLASGAIAGNILFVLWLLYNGISEGFPGSMIEKLSYIALMGLLLVNAFLLIRKKGN